VAEMDTIETIEDPWGPNPNWVPGDPMAVPMGGHFSPADIVDGHAAAPVTVTEVDRRACAELGRVLMGFGLALVGEPVPGVAYEDLLEVFRRPAWSPSLAPWWDPDKAPKSYRRLASGGRRARLRHLIRRSEALLSMHPDDEAQMVMLMLAQTILAAIVSRADALLSLSLTLTAGTHEPEAIDRDDHGLAPPGHLVATGPIAANAPPRASTPVLFAREAIAA